MIPVVHRNNDFVLAPEGEMTNGTVFFTLQASKQESNTSTFILAGAIGALFFLI